ncbi:metal-dependent hydrolase [Vibrio fortis]|uniref:Metal-dependent hydrolase n=1 Tax=Vibrio fortis TaxID=212667 RepID=A0A066UJB9_9VIBR|nr:endonuclease/exonuclease/phosphatase family protein [Vibrio fortis]KDN27145.1 metal-dependent hydrolase [Vibrio fortis]
MNILQKWVITTCLFSSTALSAPLSISSWNIEWLSTNEAVNKMSELRKEKDFNQLSYHFKQLNSDVMAFQEVDNIEAIKRVVGPDFRIVMSDRASNRYKANQFSDVNQYTGFAVRQNINVVNKPDLKLETRSGSKLRFASYIVAELHDKPVHLLSVHLKAGCSGAYKRNNNCERLKQQAKVLNDWIVEREKKQQSYAVLGDFNHNLSYRGDWLWFVLSENNRAQLATRSTSADCKVRSNRNKNRTHQFRSLIDHIVVSDDLSTSSTKQYVFPSQDVLDYFLSDHCPVSTQIER